MCLLITVLAAIITTFVWYFKARDERFQLLKLVFMYWGAALMWSVDGFYALAEGESFLDLSKSDGMLGIIIVVCGLAMWGIFCAKNLLKKQQSE